MKPYTIEAQKLQNQKASLLKSNVGGWQNSGPFLGTLNIRCRTILGTQKGTIILTTTHV